MMTTIEKLYIGKAAREGLLAAIDDIMAPTIGDASIRMIEKHYGKLLKEKVREPMSRAPMFNIA